MEMGILGDSEVAKDIGLVSITEVSFFPSIAKPCHAIFLFLLDILFFPQFCIILTYSVTQQLTVHFLLCDAMRDGNNKKEPYRSQGQVHERGKVTGE